MKKQGKNVREEKRQMYTINKKEENEGQKYQKEKKMYSQRNKRKNKKYDRKKEKVMKGLNK